MNDLISRQAAIDAIEQMQTPIMRSEFPEEQFVFTGMSEALRAIKGLPSVQPEIIRCKDCAYYEKDYSDKLLGWCNVWSNKTRYDGYCHEAEPKGEQE